MKKKILNIVFILIVFFPFSSCNNINLFVDEVKILNYYLYINYPYYHNILNEMNSKVSRNDFYRDSILIQQTMYMFRDSLEGWYKYYNQETEFSEEYYSFLDSCKFYVNNVFYDTKKLKLVSFCIVKKIDEEDFIRTSDYLYDTQMLIGYRSDTNSIWKLYPFVASIFIDYSDSINIVNEWLHRYFGDFKDQRRDVYIPNEKETKDIYFNNLNDSLFWESFIWKKGTKRMPDKYWFEISSTGAIPIHMWEMYLKGRIKEEEFIVRGNNGFVYSDSILKLYPKSYQEKLEKEK